MEFVGRYLLAAMSKAMLVCFNKNEKKKFDFTVIVSCGSNSNGSLNKFSAGSFSYFILDLNVWMAPQFFGPHFNTYTCIEQLMFVLGQNLTFWKRFMLLFLVRCLLRFFCLVRSSHGISSHACRLKELQLQSNKQSSYLNFNVNVEPFRVNILQYLWLRANIRHVVCFFSFLSFNLSFISSSFVMYIYHVCSCACKPYRFILLYMNAKCSHFYFLFDIPAIWLWWRWCRKYDGTKNEHFFFLLEISLNGNRNMSIGAEFTGV